MIDENEKVKDEVREVYGPGLKEEFGHIDESLIEKIASIFINPDSWTEWGSNLSRKEKK